MPESIALTEAVFYILISLYEPRHGYAIMQDVLEKSGGRVALAAGTLYGALNTLLERGWIRHLPSADGARKKECEITPVGKEAVRMEIARLQELLDNGLCVTGGKA